MKRLTLALAALLAFTAFVQAQREIPVVVHFTKGLSGAGFDPELILGGFVQSISEDGLVTIQNDDDDGTTSTLQLDLGGATLTQEQVEDYVGALVTAATSTSVTVTYDDAAGEVSFSLPDSQLLPASPSDDQVPQWDATNEVWVAADVAAGTGTDDQTASEVDTDTANFGTNLSSSDTTVQAALETLDDLSVGSGTGLTLEQMNRLNAVPGLEAKTADLSIETIGTTWTAVAAVADGGFATHANGNTLSTAQAAALTFSASRNASSADAARFFTILRVPDTEDVRNFRVVQTGSLGTFYITAWNTIGSTGGFTYAYSQHNLFENYAITVEESSRHDHNPFPRRVRC